MKRLKAIIIVIVISVVCVGGLYIYDRLGNFEANIWTKDIAFTENDYVKLMTPNDSYKILQITDLHLALIFTPNNNKTFDMLNNMIDTEKPDLVIVTGDLTIGLFNRAMLRNFADFMEEKEQYWMYVLGNHDFQFGSGAYRYLSVLADYKYCLFDVGYTNLGYGNNFAVLYANNEAIHTLTLIDTSKYRTNTEQAEWYKWGMYNLKELYGDLDNMIFMHIPLNVVKENVKDVEEKINALKAEPLLYDYILELGQTKYIANGHDHMNSYAVEIDGVKFINCLSTGFSGYGRKDIPRGAIVYNFYKDRVDYFFKTQYDYV